MPSTPLSPRASFDKLDSEGRLGKSHYHWLGEVDLVGNELGKHPFSKCEGNPESGTAGVRDLDQLDGFWIGVEPEAASEFTRLSEWLGNAISLRFFVQV